jgi:hypothetical protein
MLFSSNILQSGLKGVFGSDLCLFEIIGDIFFKIVFFVRKYF